MSKVTRPSPLTIRVAVAALSFSSSCLTNSHTKQTHSTAITMAMRRAAGTTLASFSAAATRRPAASVASSSLAGRPPLYPTTATLLRRSLASDADSNSAESLAREERMRTLLMEHFSPTHLLIQDVSGM